MANYYCGARFFDCRVFFNKNYTQLLLISSVMILLPYFLVSAFYLKESIRHKRTPHIAIASVASIYALWLLYAAGLDLLLLSGVLYLVGLVIFQSATLSIKIAQTKPA